MEYQDGKIYCKDNNGCTIASFDLYDNLITASCDSSYSYTSTIEDLNEKVDKISKEYEEEKKKMDNKIEKMLKDYENEYFHRIGIHRTKMKKELIENDPYIQMITEAKDKLVTDLLLLNKDKFNTKDYIHQEDELTKYFDIQLDQIITDSKHNIVNLYTLDTKDKITKINEECDEEIKAFENLLKEVKIHLSLVETYEQAIEVFKAYGIITSDNKLYYKF